MNPPWPFTKLFRSNLKNKCERLEYECERLEQQKDYYEREYKHARSRLGHVFEYIKDENEELWREMCKVFSLCPYCGYDEDVEGESHFNWSHQECPAAFIQNCQDWVDETGNGNSTRSVIQMLFDTIKSHGDMEAKARSYHELWVGHPTNEDPNFDEYLKESGNSIEDIVWDGLWSDGRDQANIRTVEYWIEDYEENIQPIPSELHSKIWW